MQAAGLSERANCGLPSSFKHSLDQALEKVHKRLWLVGDNVILATLAALITFLMIAGNTMSLLDKITSKVCLKERSED